MTLLVGKWSLLGAVILSLCVVASPPASGKSQTSEPKALKAHEGRCARGDQSACSTLASVYEGGWWGLDKNPVLAEIYRAMAGDGTANSPPQIVYANGDRYFGLLNAENQQNGYGAYFFANGSSYKGEWKNGNPHGYGVFDSLDERWEGNFVNGGRDSSGMEQHWVSKAFGDSHYTGYLNADGQWHGEGELVAANGERYKGQWRNGKRHDVGEASWADGSHYKGSWVDGEITGYGKLTTSDGRRFEGRWQNGKLNGSGRISYPDGSEMSGTFVNGLLDGVVKIKTQGSDVVAQVLYSQGKPFEYLSDNRDELLAKELARIERNRQAEMARIEANRQAVLAQQQKELAAMEAERRRFQSNLLLLQLANAIATGQPMFGSAPPPPSGSSQQSLPSTTTAGYTTCVYLYKGGNITQTVRGYHCPPSMKFSHGVGYLQSME